MRECIQCKADSNYCICKQLDKFFEGIIGKVPLTADDKKENDNENIHG